MKPTLYNAKFKTPCYRSTIWLAGLNLNMTNNTKEYFRLTGFWASLYIRFLTKKKCKIIKQTIPSVSYYEYAE
jgi:hypothetical protein